MRSRLCVAALALLPVACVSLSGPAENSATLVAGGTVRIVQVDGKKVCAFGGLMTSALGCPESVELPPGPHMIAVTSYLNQTSADGTVEINAQPHATYTVSASIRGYSVSFRVEESRQSDHRDPES